jgi:hypothetical protein
VGLAPTVWKGKIMRTEPNRKKVTAKHLVIAVVLLLGIMVLAYGYFYESKIGLYVGLLLTAAGVLVGILQIILRGNK